VGFKSFGEAAHAYSKNIYVKLLLVSLPHHLAMLGKSGLFDPITIAIHIHSIKREGLLSLGEMIQLRQLTPSQGLYIISFPVEVLQGLRLPLLDPLYLLLVLSTILKMTSTISLLRLR
jgi:hypothetical protein